MLANNFFDTTRANIEARGMRVISIASPVLKCVLPDAPPVDARFQQDVFGSSYTFADQPRLTGAPDIGWIGTLLHHRPQ